MTNAEMFQMTWGFKPEITIGICTICQCRYIPNCHRAHCIYADTDNFFPKDFWESEYKAPNKVTNPDGTVSYIAYDPDTEIVEEK